MSWWITLEENDNIIDTDTIRTEGGVQVFGGMTEAELNVTYNYSKHFNFDQLNKMKAVNAIPILQIAITNLGDEIDSDYWKPTEGNVKRTLKILLEFAEYAIKKGFDAYFVVS